MSITLNGKQIKELAEIAGFEINEDRIDEDYFEAEYTIGRCPDIGILDEDSGNILHPHLIVTEDSVDGECHPLSD